MTRKKTAEHEKIKLEIAKLISQNDEFLKKIASYRRIVNHTISAGCGDYYSYTDISPGSGSLFMVIGTKDDIKLWCDRQGFVFEDIAARKLDAGKVANLAITEITSFRLLSWIDEEICSIYYTYSNRQLPSP